MTGGALDRNIVQFEAGRDAAEHQAAAAHVTAADEVDRKRQLTPEDRQQDVDVLPGCDAAKQHDVAVRSDGVSQAAGALLEGQPVF